jgi:hypothetical protein
MPNYDITPYDRLQSSAYPLQSWSADTRTMRDKINNSVFGLISLVSMQWGGLWSQRVILFEDADAGSTRPSNAKNGWSVMKGSLLLVDQLKLKFVTMWDVNVG